MIVKINETQKLEFAQGANIAGFSIGAYITHDTDNTAFVAGEIDWSKVRMKLSVKKKGSKMEHNPFNETALPLLLHSSYRKGNFNQFLANSTDYTILKAHGATNPAEGYVGGIIDLGAVLNLQSGDKAVLTVTPDSGAFSANISTADSYFDVNVVEGVGVSPFIPFIKTEAIANGRSTYTNQLGENITDVMFINAKKTDILQASAVVSSVSFSSDKLSYEDSYLELLAKRINEFTTKATADSRYQSFDLVQITDGQELDEVRLDISLNATNVTDSMNWVIWRQNYTDVELMAMANAEIQGREQVKLEKILNS